MACKTGKPPGRGNYHPPCTLDSLVAAGRKGDSTRRASRRALARMDLALDSRRQLVFGFFEFVIALQSQPEFRRRTKITSQPKRSVRRDRALPLHDFCDPIGRHPQIHRDSMDADSGGNDEILVQDLTGMKRRYLLCASHVCVPPGFRSKLQCM